MNIEMNKVMTNFISIILSLLILTSCSHIQNQVTDHNESPEESDREFCNDERQEAKENLKTGCVYYVINLSIGGWFPRYEKELEQVLKSYNVELEIYPVSCVVPNDGYCYKQFMDSVLISRYGSDFSNMINQKADSLFASKRHEKIYSDWEVDEQPFISETIINETGDPFIDLLNSALDTTSEFRYVSNCIGFSHFIIEYTVDSLGKSSNCIVVEEEFINNENEVTKDRLRKELINKVNSMTIWTPGLLLGNKVTVREQRGTALTWER
jgi:hypothetical protein